MNAWRAHHPKRCATQNQEERAHAEQYLRVFGQSIEYIAHCKVAKATRCVQDDRLSDYEAYLIRCYVRKWLACAGSRVWQAIELSA